MFFRRENRARFEAANGIGALRDETGRFPTGIILTKALSSHPFPEPPLRETFPGSESNLEIKAGINGEVVRGKILHSLRAHLNFVPQGPSSSAEEELLFCPSPCV